MNTFDVKLLSFHSPSPHPMTSSMPSSQSGFPSQRSLALIHVTEPLTELHWNVNTDSEHEAGGRGDNVEIHHVPICVVVM